MTGINKAIIYFAAGLITGIFIVLQLVFREDNKKTKMLNWHQKKTLG